MNDLEKDRVHLAEQVSQWVSGQEEDITAVGGLTACVDAMLLASYEEIPMKDHLCSQCQHPILEWGSWIRPHTKHVCHSCGHVHTDLGEVLLNPLNKYLKGKTITGPVLTISGVP